HCTATSCPSVGRSRWKTRPRSTSACLLVPSGSVPWRRRPVPGGVASRARVVGPTNSFGFPHMPVSRLPLLALALTLATPLAAQAVHQVSLQDAIGRADRSSETVDI